MLTRLKEHENSNLYSKLRVYDGEKLKDTDPKAKSHQEYRDAAGIDEGMDGISTRFAYKVLSETFNFDTDEVAADPVHLMYVLENAIKREQYPEEVPRRSYLDFIKSELSRRVMRSSSARKSRRPIWKAMASTDKTSLTAIFPMRTPGSRIRTSKIPDTGQLLDRSTLDAELSKIEKPAGIANPKDFRNEVVKFALARAGQRMKARTRPGRLTRSSATSLKSACSARSKTCFPSSRSNRRKIARPLTSTTSSSQRMVERGTTRRARFAVLSSGICG